MKTVSLVIPTRRVNEQMLQHCIDSFQGQYDELIVVDKLWDNLSKKINYGVQQATKDFVVICNDDVLSISGSLRDLCTGDVESPYIREGVLKTFHAHCWCLPRDVYFEVGGMSEEYEQVYYDDSDMWMRLVTHGYLPKINMDVIISHPNPATTIKTLPNDMREYHNRLLFTELWGEKGLEITQCR